MTNKKQKKRKESAAAVLMILATEKIEMGDASKEGSIFLKISGEVDAVAGTSKDDQCGLIWPGSLEWEILGGTPAPDLEALLARVAVGWKRRRRPSFAAIAKGSNPLGDVR